MLKIIALLLLLITTGVFAAEDPGDSYSHATECPENGQMYYDRLTSDEFGAPIGFVRCQCTSYVADKLSELFAGRFWSYHGTLNISKIFANDQYYMPQQYVSATDGHLKKVLKWSNANFWANAALRAGIGVTGAKDNFTWDEKSYNAVFPGDVAWWDAWPGNTAGHVAIVERVVERDVAGKGVRCVEISDYNFGTDISNGKFGFRRRTVCKGDPGHAFPSAFIHIDQDHAYCAANPEIGNCPALFGKLNIISVGTKGYGIGGGSDAFNLTINNFWVKDSSNGYVLIPDGHTVLPGQALEVRSQIKAQYGDTHDHMRPQKNRIEIDFYVREDLGEWRFLKREYVKDTNLPNGATHTEHIGYTVPVGVQSVSFKVKIDAEDEAFESNEGDNLSQILTFQINNNPTYDLTVTGASVIGPSLPIIAGSSMGAQTTIRNMGNSAPLVESRLEYAIRGPGTNNLWLPIASDGSKPEDLIPGRDHEERIQRLVPAPTIPGKYELKVTADYENVIAELNEGNNTLTTTFSVVPRPAPILSIIRFEDKVGCCTTNRGAAPKPRIWIKNSGQAAPAANVTVIYQIASPVATGGAYILMGYGTIEPRELPPGGVDEDQMDCDGCWRIPNTSAWKERWHNIRACIRADGGTPTGDPARGDICSTTYARFSKK